MQMKIVTSTIDGSEQILIPAREPRSNHPPSPNSTTAINPTDHRRDGEGRSTSALINARPGKRSRDHERDDHPEDRGHDDGDDRDTPVR
jgi:hypothetical protein